MESKDGEIVKLSKVIDCVGQVEDWLRIIEEKMRESL